MKKIAIFSEGQTEQIFVAEVIRFIATSRSFYVKKEKLLGGKKFSTVVMSIDDNIEQTDPSLCDFYFLLIDCASDGRVISSIAERYDGLVNQGYDHIIGMRDLAPSFRRDQLDRLVSTANRTLTKTPIDPLLIVAVMEVEAWFISEITHFQKIDEGLTPEKILERTGINLLESAEDRDEPAKDMAKIYQLAGHEYGKSRADVEKTVGALDLAEFVDERALARAKSVAPLFERLNAIFLDEQEPDDQAVA